MLGGSWEMCINVSDNTPATAQLATRAFVRLQMAHRPATQRNYFQMYKDFFAFLVATGLSPVEVTPAHLLMFLYPIYENSMSASNVENYQQLSTR